MCDLIFIILLQTQSIVCATVDSQCLEYLGYINLGVTLINIYLTITCKKWKCKNFLINLIFDG